MTRSSRDKRIGCDRALLFWALFLCPWVLCDNCKVRHEGNLYLYDFSSLKNLGPIDGDWLIPHPTKPWFIYANLCANTNRKCGAIDTEVCLVSAKGDGFADSVNASLWTGASAFWTTGDDKLDDVFKRASGAIVPSCNNPFSWSTSDSGHEGRGDIAQYISTTFVLKCKEGVDLSFEDLKIGANNCTYEMHFFTEDACTFRPYFIVYVVLISLGSIATMILGRNYSKKEFKRQFTYLKVRFPLVIDLVRRTNNNQIALCAIYSLLVFPVAQFYFRVGVSQKSEFVYLVAMGVILFFCGQQSKTIIGSLLGVLFTLYYTYAAAIMWLGFWLNSVGASLNIVFGISWIVIGCSVAAFFFIQFLLNVYEKRNWVYAESDVEYEFAMYEKDVATLLKMKFEEKFTRKKIDAYVLNSPTKTFLGVTIGEWSHLIAIVRETFVPDIFLFIKEKERDMLEEETQRRYLPFSQRFLFGMAGSFATVTQLSILNVSGAISVRDSIKSLDGSSEADDISGFADAVFGAILACIIAIFFTSCYIWSSSITTYRKNLLKVRKGTPFYDKKNKYSLMDASLYVGIQVGYTFIGYFFIIFWLALFTSIVIGLFYLSTLKSLFVSLLLDFLFTVILGSFLTTCVKKITVKYFFTVDRRFMIKNHLLWGLYETFSVFLDIIVGVWSALSRIAKGMLFVGILFIRTDLSIYPEGFTEYDQGYCAYIGMLLLENNHNNPIVWVFLRIITSKIQMTKGMDSTMKIAATEDEQMELLNRASIDTPLVQHSPTKKESSPILAQYLRNIEVRKRARIQWFLLYTLVRNPRLAKLRKHALLKHPEIVTEAQEADPTPLHPE